MGSLDAEITRLLNNSLAKGTRAAYIKGIEEFQKFRNIRSQGYVWPALSQHVADYIAHLSLLDYAASTINVKVSAIAFFHKINGWDDPTDNFLVKKLREGCRRENKVEDTRCPITLPILMRLVHVLHGVCYNDYEAVMFKNAFLLAYFGFLRVGEFSKTPNVALSRLLAVSDIQMGQGKMEVKIRFSKADQGGRGEIITIGKHESKEVCPVGAMQQYLTMRPQGEGPLFIHLQGEPLTAAQFSSVLKKGIQTIGLDPENFSSHSFRIGAATAAAANGTPLHDIKNMGRWRSQSVLSYIRPQREINL